MCFVCGSDMAVQENIEGCAIPESSNRFKTRNVEQPKKNNQKKFEFEMVMNSNRKVITSSFWKKNTASYNLDAVYVVNCSDKCLERQVLAA